MYLLYTFYLFLSKIVIVLIQYHFCIIIYVIRCFVDLAKATLKFIVLFLTSDRQLKQDDICDCLVDS